jgi:hypothetical protein
MPTALPAGGLFSARRQSQVDMTTRDNPDALSAVDAVVSRGLDKLRILLRLTAPAGTSVSRYDDS